MNSIKVNSFLTTEAVFLLLQNHKGFTFLDSSLANSNLGSILLWVLNLF
ncbi:hypothetical protein [endosymbiont 'TC1' of Trimyema compressum]|nr:hypothetical protein [endosymbiont 'TC1' of Trimyema compressum]